MKKAQKPLLEAWKIWQESSLPAKEQNELYKEDGYYSFYDITESVVIENILWNS